MSRIGIDEGLFSSTVQTDDSFPHELLSYCLHQTMHDLCSPDKALAHAKAIVVQGLEQRFPKAAQLLLEAEEDIRACRDASSSGFTHWLWASAILVEQQDEWTVIQRRCFSQESMN